MGSVVSAAVMVWAAVKVTASASPLSRVRVMGRFSVGASSERLRVRLTVVSVPSVAVAVVSAKARVAVPAVSSSVMVRVAVAVETVPQPAGRPVTVPNWKVMDSSMVPVSVSSAAVRLSSAEAVLAGMMKVVRASCQARGEVASMLRAPASRLVMVKGTETMASTGLEKVTVRVVACVPSVAPSVMVVAARAKERVLSLAGMVKMVSSGARSQPVGRLALERLRQILSSASAVVSWSGVTVKVWLLAVVVKLRVVEEMVTSVTAVVVQAPALSTV